MNESKKSDAPKPEPACLQFIGILAKAVAEQLKLEERERRKKNADVPPSVSTANPLSDER